MRSGLGVLVVDECFCQLQTETILGSSVQQRNAKRTVALELVFGSDSRFTEESRGTKHFYIVPFTKLNLIKV